jgi:hypothetical protein
MGRQVSRLMNDPTLGPLQKQRLVTRVQERLLAHEAKLQARSEKKASKKEMREITSRSAEQVAADPKGLIARRKEFRLIEGSVTAPAVTQKPQLPIAANDRQMTGWHRPLLTLKRA